MRELNVKEIQEVNGGWSNDNNNLFSTVVRNAGFGAMGGALGGPVGAGAGAVLGALVGFSVYYNNK
ncbi:Blp family class II bacteriocin [Pseudoalteromonas prydzensis]|uniref:Blp family class II bacteriocin n=1 Tax=Pseudoalteromonas prydzensis TaxID=182141 RepID=UPI0037044608